MFPDLEQKILRHYRSYTTGATELRGHDGQMQQREQEVPHVRSGRCKVTSVCSAAKQFLGRREGSTSHLVPRLGAAGCTVCECTSLSAYSP